MQKGDIQNRYGTLRNRNEGDGDTGIYWLANRLGKMRNLVVVVGFGFCFIYGYFWFKKHGEVFEAGKTTCQKAYQLPVQGTVAGVFLDAGSKGRVTLKVIQQKGDTVEYFTGWGQHPNAGMYIKKGYTVSKPANSFDLQIVQTDSNKTITLQAPQKTCEE